MVKLIIGLKGSGKTKALVGLVCKAVDEDTGDVICIEKDRKLTYDIPYKARLIDAGSYDIGSYEFLKGFISGIHAGNYDITHFFIDNFFKLAKEMRVEIPEDMKYFCVTETIALYIQKYVQYRKRKVFFGTTGKINDLLPTMVKHKTEKYLVPMSEVHNDDVKNLLDSKKLIHRECVMYRTVSNDFTEEEIKSFDYDMLVFFSPMGIKSFKKNFPDMKNDNLRIATFGPATARGG